MSDRWLTQLGDVPTATTSELRRNLLTCDGAGRSLKAIALDELLRREQLHPSVNGSSLRSLSLDTTVFAIGIEHTPGQFGMTHGPVPDLREMRAVVGDSGSCIIEFKGARQRVLYRWRDDAWCSVELAAWLDEAT